MSSQRVVFKNRTFQKYFADVKRTGTLELFIDWEHLVESLGTRAAFNKSQKSALGAGIKAKFSCSETTKA